METTSRVLAKINYLFNQIKAIQQIEFCFNNAINWTLDEISDVVATQCGLLLMIETYTNLNEYYELSALARDYQLYFKDMYIVWHKTHQAQSGNDANEAETIFNNIITLLRKSLAENLDNDDLETVILHYQFKFNANVE